MQELTTKNWNKPLYFIFVIAGTFFAFRKDIAQASTFWGLALAFDPFNITQPFRERPMYQKVWLTAHLVITFTLLILCFMPKEWLA